MSSAPHDSMAAWSGGPTSGRRGALSLAHCGREFGRYSSPRIIVAALALAVGARVAIGSWAWQDALVPAVLFATEPITEWLIHVYVLHARQVRLGPLKFEPLAAPEHRAHHEAPTDLRWVFIPTPALLAFLPTIAVLIAAYAAVAHALAGGDLVAEWATGLVGAYAILAAYEWCHFLIHTTYRPRRWYFKLMWRNHRLHHYKNEHFWFGVTTHLGDVVLHTNPAQAAVPRSPTARSLGADPAGRPDSDGDSDSDVPVVAPTAPGTP